MSFFLRLVCFCGLRGRGYGCFVRVCLQFYVLFFRGRNFKRRLAVVNSALPSCSASKMRVSLPPRWKVSEVTQSHPKGRV